jgi:hypothetical protein
MADPETAKNAKGVFQIADQHFHKQRVLPTPGYKLLGCDSESAARRSKIGQELRIVQTPSA